ncbi:CHAT domain-containing protein [Azospirillum rugosum]|uniref:CHAT domain-containing protein n=1 Tax=Azospirillum rugosum TaxID=416170 RepID=A0ABS4SL98_9PROT|nr:CHAT domain-containing protein [Azospirillum rugosum]MBP2293285.1 CHAT domain-containing protein [Azospirillum rugosum]
MNRASLLGCALAVLVPLATETPHAEDMAAAADALARRAEAHRAAGKITQSLAELSEARRLAEQAGDASLLAAIDAAVADVATAGTLDSRARAQWAHTLDQLIARAKPGQERTRAAALNTLGRLRDMPDAVDALRQSATLARRAGDPALAATAGINAARRLAATDAPAEAETLLREAEADLAALPDDHRKAFLLVAHGVALMNVQASARQNRSDLVRRCRDSLEKAATLARSIGDRRTLSAARGYLGTLYERLGRPDDALALTREAVFLAQEIMAADLLFRWHWQAGRLHRSQGRTGDALASYDAAIAAIRRVRSDLLRAYGGYGSAFREAIGPVYLEFADLRLRQASVLRGTPQAQKHLVAARDALEQLKAAELEDYFQDDCVAALKAKVKAIDPLAPGTAVLYPILLPDRLELLLSLSDGLHQATVPVGAAEIGAVATNFRRRLEQRTSSLFLSDARTLYDWLVRPLAPLLDRRGVNTLVLVPDGPLRSVPLAAVHDGNGFLVERYALAVTPGLSLMEPKPLTVQQAELLLAGLTESVQGFPPLPFVESEIATIHGTLGGTILENRSFMIERVGRELNAAPYSIVHIASHGKFEPEARDSYILAYDGRLSMDQLERFVKLSQYREEPVELLTLSACQTAAGDDRAALGLAGVAIKAGARSALASLWFINDQASSQLIADFYRRLAAGGLGKAEALRQAQLAMLKDLRYQHPGYWAAFLLIGNWL